MPDLTFTDVRLIDDKPVQPDTILLGETCAAFDVVQQIANKYVRSTATDAAKSRPSHILLQGGNDLENVVALPLATGQSFQLIGATTVLGDQYVLSANLGKIADRADLVPTNLLTDIAKGSSASEKIIVSVEATGIVL